MIQTLRDTATRQGFDSSIRAVAIDLGSVEDESLSGAMRTGDLAAVAGHIRNLVRPVLDHPEEASDEDFRLAVALESIAQVLIVSPPNQSRPSFSDLQGQLRACFQFVNSPWLKPNQSLAAYDESYNALTLIPWYVSRLVVDPGGWMDRVSAPGPQIVFGMRGCGKTMLLKAFDFHSRAARPGDPEEVLNQDGYIGLYLNSIRLQAHDPGIVVDESAATVQLLLGYSAEIVQAARHLTMMVSDAMSPFWYQDLAELLESLINGLSLTKPIIEVGFERDLYRAIWTSGQDAGFTLSVAPPQAFEALARLVTGLSRYWRNKHVLFLLDDVSTRYLSEASIRHLVSPLLVSSTLYSFKITTETQTMESVLRSPGMIESAREGRDFGTFDLGLEIASQMTMRGNQGTSFLEAIVNRRGQYVNVATHVTPGDLLGRVSLAQIARDIASADKDGRGADGIYRGVRALVAACSGDIGDALHLYDEFRKQADRDGVLRLSNEAQHGVFLRFAERKMFRLNRRSADVKNYAVGFARASHRELIRSARPNADANRGELRQYSQIRVELGGMAEQQVKRIVELADAGVFILLGSPESVRMKDSSRGPLRQITLVYRRLLGMGSLSPLAQRDRFELSGDRLDRWVSEPEHCEAILLESISGTHSEAMFRDDNEPVPADAGVSPREAANRFGTGEKADTPLPEDGPSAALGRQGNLFEVVEEPESILGSVSALPNWKNLGLPVVEARTQLDIAAADVALVIAAAGFEDRCMKSLERVAESVGDPRVLLVQYDNNQGRLVSEWASNRFTNVGILQDPNALPELEHPVLVDVSGLSKPFIFAAVAESLAKFGEVHVAYTGAASYSPSEERSEQLLEDLPVRGLPDLGNDASFGEQGPYRHVRLLGQGDGRHDRRRALIASASSKHERASSLIEMLAIDAVDFLVPTPDSARRRLAALTAEIAGQECPECQLIECGRSVDSYLKVASEVFSKRYFSENFDVHLGLTGSKLHAVGAAALSQVVKPAGVWYSAPTVFDRQNFSVGAQETEFLRIRMVRSV